VEKVLRHELNGVARSVDRVGLEVVNTTLCPSEYDVCDRYWRGYGSRGYLR
jgi:hypothetical protein